MDTERLLESGVRGVHLLFDTGTITAAFAQDAARLEAWVRGEPDGVERAIRGLLAQPSATEGRAFVARLPQELQYVLVLLYFELLDERLRKRRTLH